MAKRPTTAKSGLTRKQRSRAQREARMQRSILIATVVIAVAVVGLLAFALLNEYVFKPRRAVVTVNGEKVGITEFQERVKFDYYLQTGGQPPEMLGVDAVFFGQMSLDSLINDILLEQKAAEMGIVVSDEEAIEQIELAFGFDRGDPEPTPTLAPTSAVPTAEPTITPTFVYTQTPSPTPTLEPGVTPTATPAEAPEATETPPAALPTSTPPPTPEPLTEQEYEDQFTEFIDPMAAITGLTVERIRAFWIHQMRMELIRTKLVEALDLEVPETKTLVNAAHILVETQEEALEVLERLNAGEDFGVIAAEVSIDTSNAYKGGDLGWFGRGRMVAEFEEAAFALDVGETSGPVQTQFGWHIIRVLGRDDNVPLTEAERQQELQSAFREVLNQWRSEATIDIDDAWQEYLPSLP